MYANEPLDAVSSMPTSSVLVTVPKAAAIAFATVLSSTATNANEPLDAVSSMPTSSVLVTVPEAAAMAFAT
eukprot:59927-Prymnesium_polylepis.1